MADIRVAVRMFDSNKLGLTPIAVCPDIPGPYGRGLKGYVISRAWKKHSVERVRSLSETSFIKDELKGNTRQPEGLGETNDCEFIRKEISNLFRIGKNNPIWI